MYRDMRKLDLTINNIDEGTFAVTQVSTGLDQAFLFVKEEAKCVDLKTGGITICPSMDSLIDYAMTNYGSV